MQFLKQKYYLILAPLIVMGIMFIVFYQYNLFPFGYKALDWGDMAQQNLPVLIDFKDILNGKTGPFFSMANAGGMDFLGMFLFLASSPFSLLAGFIEKANLVYYINIMIMLKLMTCSVTSGLFFKKFFKNLNHGQIIALSISYSICGYSMMFYQLHTWLDVMYMFPLLMIGFYKLVFEEKITPYVISLSLMILFQFYLGYMVALFLIFAFAVYLLFFSDPEKRKRSVVFFAIGTVLAIMITSPVLVPALVQYMNSARTVSLIDSLCSGFLTTDLGTTIPFILATSLLIVVIPFLYRKNLYRDKTAIPLIIMFTLLLVPIIINPINKMWHTGSYQAFPVRYGYMAVLVGLSLAALFMERMNLCNRYVTETKKIPLILFMVVILEYLVFSRWYVNTYDEALQRYSTTLWGDNKFMIQILIFSVVTCAILFVLFMQYKKKRLSSGIFSLLLCSVIIIEAFFNCSVYIGFGARDTKGFNQAISLSNSIDDDDTYRVKVENKYFDVNLVGAMGYNSLAHYTSLIDSDYIFAMKKLGYSSYWMEVNSNGSTAFTDALLGNKYTIIRYNNMTGYEDVVHSNDVYNICKNEYNMSLGNVISKNQLEALKTIPPKDRISFQQTLYQTLTNRKTPLVHRYDISSSGGVLIQNNGGDTNYAIKSGNAGALTYQIFVSGRQNLYFDCFRNLTTNLSEPINDSFNIIVNGNNILRKYPAKYANGMLDLGTFENETVNISISVLKSSYANSFGVFGIDLDELGEGIKTMNPADVKLDGDKITATATATQDNQSLMLTIPYSEGFKVSVNGKTVKAEKMLDAFMAIPLEKGENTVSLSYSPYGLNIGLIIFFVGIFALIATALLFKRFKYKPVKLLENTLYYGFLSIAGILFIVVYIFPVIVYSIYYFSR